MIYQEVLQQIVKFPAVHARFMNTLSFLEYVGARKILKSQIADTITFQVLAHAAEEIRHAQVLKKIALKLSQGELDSYSPDQLLCGFEASCYIQTLDRAVEKELGEKNPWLNYLYTTLLIEERANQVYPYYEPLLAECGFPGVLKAIVREEDHHLKEIEDELKDAEGIAESRLNLLREIEKKAFHQFISAVGSAIVKSEPSPKALATEISP